MNRRAESAQASETTRVIVRFEGGVVPAEFEQYARSGKLDIIDGYVLDVPNQQLQSVAEHASTVFGSLDDTVHAFNFRTSVQSGAFFARRMMGATGKGVGVAVIDSGVNPNEEFTKWQGVGRSADESRVRHFEDFLVPDNYHTALTDPPCDSPCDTNGHGTHVAGTIAGNGFDSFGQKSGMAPDASIIALRVLGKDGSGSLSGVLAALQWVLQNAHEYNIRVVNMSFGMAPTGSLPNHDPALADDPLAVATKKLVDAGIFVVSAAGNLGQIDCARLVNAPTPPTPDPVTGKCDVWGGITRPGTYPWVFTAGANSSMGTYARDDDTRARFSSRGPAFPLQNAKPDLLAGAVGIESVSVPGSTLFGQALPSPAHPLGFLVDGAFPTAAPPYMTLSGTSQAAAVVSGVAAQMLQANPRLTPNLLKAILEYTAQEYNPGVKGYSPLEQGAGFLNALGAVRLSRFYAKAREGARVPVESIWSRHIIWGNHELSGGFMLPKANAWAVGVAWGAAQTEDGDNIVWGTACGLADCGDNIVWGTSGDADNIVWGTAGEDNIVWGTSADGDNIVWGTAAADDNIVWGTDCGGADCGDNIVWGTAADGGDNIVWGTAEEAEGDNIVWGTAADGSDNIVWGTAGDDNIVWGTAESNDNIVWGTAADGDNIVWGTAANADNIVWGTAANADNIVWGTAANADNIVWGTAADGDNIVWGTAADGDNIVWGTASDGDNIVWGTSVPSGPPANQADWYQLFLNRRFASWWVAHQFGEAPVSSNHEATTPSPDSDHGQDQPSTAAGDAVAPPEGNGEIPPVEPIVDPPLEPTAVPPVEPTVVPPTDPVADPPPPPIADPPALVPTVDQLSNADVIPSANADVIPSADVTSPAAPVVDVPTATDRSATEGHHGERSTNHESGGSADSVSHTDDAPLAQPPSPRKSSDDGQAGW